MSAINGRDPEVAAAIMGGEHVRRFRKTALVFAFPSSEETLIDTPEGQMLLRVGDYLVSDDPPTHLWPVQREVFERTYVESRPCGDPLGACLYAMPHLGPHKVAPGHPVLRGRVTSEGH